MVFCVRFFKFNSQHLQVGEATESSVCDEAHAVVSDVELIQQTEPHETGFFQSGQMVGGEVPVGQKAKTIR